MEYICILMEVNTIGWSTEGLSDNLVPRASPWPWPLPFSWGETLGTRLVVGYISVQMTVMSEISLFQNFLRA